MTLSFIVYQTMALSRKGIFLFVWLAAVNQYKVFALLSQYSTIHKNHTQHLLFSVSPQVRWIVNRSLRNLLQYVNYYLCIILISTYIILLFHVNHLLRSGLMPSLPRTCPIISFLWRQACLPWCILGVRRQRGSSGSALLFAVSLL